MPWLNEGKVHNFAFKWVNILGNQLAEFHSTIPFDGTVAQSSMELTSVTFSCGMSSAGLLPAINPLRDFLWQCFQPKNKALEFPNLTTLRFTCDRSRRPHENIEDIMRMGPPPGNLKLQFPKLNVLDIKVKNADDIVFRPEVTLSHLNRFKMSIQDVAFLDFGGLPIKSAGYLYIEVGQCYVIWDEKFRNITNHLFGEVPITKEVNVCIGIDYTDTVDVE